MNIGVVTATFPPYRGGTGHVAFHNARTLAERGHQVTVWTRATAAEPGGASDGEGLPFRVMRLPPLAAVGNAAWLPHLSSRLAGYEVVHVHYPDIWGAIAAARATARSRGRLVLTLHNRLVDGAPTAAAWAKAAVFRGYEAWVTPWLFHRAQALVVMSTDHFATWGRPHASVAVIPHGVDGGLFCPQPQRQARQHLGLPERGVVLLFVGALDAAHRFKNVPLLLAALRHLDPAVRLVVAGDGNRRAALEREAVRLGVRRQVWFVGTQAPSRLPAWYAAADATVLPSVSTESFGLVLLESLATETPVVATALPGVRTVVRTGQDGLLVEPGRLDALVRALRVLVQRPAWRRTLGRHGRRRVVEQYSWGRAGEQLEALFSELRTGGE